MSRSRSLARNLMIALAFSAGINAAYAADLGLPVAGEEPLPSMDQNVEFGTGWYIRGDVGFAKDTMPLITPDLTQFLSGNKWQNSVNLGGGFGYKFTDMFRVDLGADYFNPVVATGSGPGITCVTRIQEEPLQNGQTGPVPTATDRCTPRGSANIQRWDVLANAYVDLGTWYGFTPYVGAGMGVSIIRQSSNTSYYMSNGLPYHVSTDGFYFDFDHTATSTRYQFAWALMAGVSYPIAPHAFLDLGYRYLNLGTVSTFQNTSGQISTHALTEQEVRLGIRYMIDGI